MFKEIIKDFKEFKSWVNEYLFVKRFSTKLYLAIKLADIKQKAFNKQYFVVLAPDGRLVAINNKDIKKLKQRNLIDKHMDSLSIKRKSFYYTSQSKNNTMPDKERLEAKTRYLTYSKKYFR
jgi:hypothetical protein